MQQDCVSADAFRFELRRQTRAEHDLLDRHPGFAGLMDGGLSLDGYRRLMLLFHGYYASLDPMLQSGSARFGLHADGFSYQSRGELLAQDLLALGFGNDALAANPKPGTLPAIRSAASLAGLLYVFEGSLLGGAVLCRATEALLEAAGHPAGGNSYWRWCKAAGGSRWAMTCRQIEALSATQRQRGERLEAARAGFRSFADWLDRWDQGRAEAGGTRC